MILTVSGESTFNDDSTLYTRRLFLYPKKHWVWLFSALLSGQVLQHFPAALVGCLHGYSLGHVMRLQSCRPSVQLHRMHSRTLPKTGCHMSPWEYVFPLYKHARWCFRCNRIFTVVSEAPLRLSLLRLRPLGEALTLGGVARSGRALICSPEHWSTECLTPRFSCWFPSSADEEPLVP